MNAEAVVVSSDRVRPNAHPSDSNAYPLGSLSTMATERSALLRPSVDRDAKVESSERADGCVRTLRGKTTCEPVTEAQILGVERAPSCPLSSQ